MAIIFNGVTLEKVIYNGIELDKVIYNRVIVFENIPQLSTPQNVTADGRVVSWDEVENATSYEVLADGASIGTVEKATGYTITINNIGDYGTYQIIRGSEHENYDVGQNKGSHTYKNVTAIGIQPYATCTISNGTGDFVNGNIYGLLEFTKDSTATLTWVD